MSPRADTLGASSSGRMVMVADAPENAICEAPAARAEAETSNDTATRRKTDITADPQPTIAKAKTAVPPSGRPNPGLVLAELTGLGPAARHNPARLGPLTAPVFQLGRLEQTAIFILQSRLPGEG